MNWRIYSGNRPKYPRKPKLTISIVARLDLHLLETMHIIS